MRMIFGPWTPDIPPHLSQGSVTALNVYPGPNGYRPLGQFSALVGGVLDTTCKGAASFVSPLGVSSIIAGTESGLYKSSSIGWQEIGSGYALQAPDRWRFAQFGAIAIATNGVDPMLKINLETAVTEPLGGNPPRARNLAVVRDFLVAGVINDEVQTLAWSGINDAESWVYGINQSDFNIMPSGGEITGMFGGEIGVILQRGRITRMTYVGDNVLFQFDEISANVGCVSANTTAQWGALGFFLSDTGFMMWDGATIKPIGEERVNRTFKARYGRIYHAGMSTAIDPTNSIVIWSLGDSLWIYNWVLDQWSTSDFRASVILPGYSRDVSLDELDGPYPELDAMIPSLDSPIFQGGDPRLYVFEAANTIGVEGVALDDLDPLYPVIDEMAPSLDDTIFDGFPATTTNTIGTLSGATMATTLKSGLIELAGAREARVRKARPLSDASGGVTVVAGATRRLGEDVVETAYSTMRTSGDIPMRERGRLMEFTHRTTSGAEFSFVQGLDLELERGARR